MKKAAYVKKVDPIEQMVLIQRRWMMRALKHYAITRQMTTRWVGHRIEGYDRGQKRWISLYCSKYE